MKSFLIISTSVIFMVLPSAAFAKTIVVIHEVVNRVETKEKVIALTFDADMTPKMLAELKAGKIKSWYNQDLVRELESEHIPATLFLTGMWIEAYPTTTEELSQNPLFELANHSYSHGAFIPHCVRLNPVKESADGNEIEKTDKLLGRYASTHIKLFRFPGLCEDNDDVKAAHQLGYTVIGGDVHGGDGFQYNPSIIAAHILKKVKSGSVVVLHMHGGNDAPKTAQALALVIPKLRNEGYTFLKVSELLKRLQ